MVNRHTTPSLRRAIKLCLGGFCALAAAGVLAQAPSIYEEQGQLIRGSQKVQALGPDLFGDKVSLYNGALEFTQTDLDLPGNHSIPVRVGRRFTTGNARIDQGHFGDWDLDIPHIKGVFSSVQGWDVVNAGNVVANRYKRCSLFSDPRPAPTQTSQVWVDADEFWHGTHMYVPGAGDMELLRRNPGGTQAPTDGLAYPVLTKAGWALRCLATIQVGGGEGFVAVSPDGVQYRFDWLVSRPYGSYTMAGGGSFGGLDRVASTELAQSAGSPRTKALPPPPDQPNVAVGQLLARQEYFLFPTQVTDRFGNWVRYNFNPANPWQLTSITSSDGRTVNLAYDGTSKRILTVTHTGRQWTYAYTSAKLTTVTRPDGARWTFSGANLQQNPQYSSVPGNCTSTGTFVASPLVRTMTHPSGARGDFTLSQVLRGRSYVLPTCPTGNGAYTNHHPVHYLVRGLTAKTISGPGMAPQTWTYNWGPANGSLSTCTNCPDTVTLDVSDPRGFTTRYTHGNRWQVNEGQLLRVDEGWSAGTAVRTTTYRYRAPEAGPYPDPAGAIITSRGDGWMGGRHTPTDKVTITQQGVSFNWEAGASAADWTAWAKPKKATAWSSLGNTRTRTTEYEDNLSKWVLGQVKSVTDSSAPASPMELNEYHPATAQRIARWAFGIKKEGFSYHADGNLHARIDEGGRPTYHDNYKLGLPQRVTYPDGTVETAVVDDRGQIVSHTNQANTTHGYGYDVMGRLASISYPSEIWGSYNPTLLTYTQVPSVEVGLAAGHWRQTIATGTGVTTNYFDALWRPVVTSTVDTNPVYAATTSKVVQTRWDIDGRKTAESYPQRSIIAYNSTLLGHRWEYDALGRETRHFQDSELGLLTTTTDYFAGFLKRVTNPRGDATTYSYQAFDQPSEDAIAAIQAPEGVAVSIPRDVFGKAGSITRSGLYGGAAVSSTRRYVYDGYQRLCKTIEPETGATIQAYDTAGNIAWRASGLGLTGTTSCDQTSVPAGSRVNHTYDARNRLKDTTYGDNSQAISRTYTPDGLLQTISSGGGSWTYSYNNRRLLWREVFSLPGYVSADTFTWGIDSNGKTASLTYPTGLSVSYTPNALGEPAQVSGFASGVGYHPNGAIAGYTLGNGVAHSLTPNVRGLPEVWRDAGVVQDVYTYDANGNVNTITDQLLGATNRSMGYDGLDRLKTAYGPWGNGSYDYDALDNLRVSVVGARSLTASIDPATNRLTALGGTQNLLFGYDANGNITARGAQGFVFDIGNRMRQATGKASYLYDGHGRRMLMSFADGSWRLQLYSQAGKLLLTRHSAQGSTEHVYLGERLIAEQAQTGGRQYAHTDALGSPVARTSATAPATVLTRTRYEPYGATVAGSTNPNGIGFTGHVNDPDTGLVYMQQRYYEPLAGRFLSVDPVTTDTKTGGSFNRYVYAENSPYIYTDPDGRSSCGKFEGLTCHTVVYDTASYQMAMGPKAERNDVAAGRVGSASDLLTAGSSGRIAPQTPESSIAITQAMRADAAKGSLFRGGASLEARLGVDVKIAGDGLVHPLAKNGKPQGLSLNIDPKDKFIQQHGGAFPVNSLPAGLQAVPSGRPGHFVISPTTAMPFERYQQLLNQVQLGNFNAIR